MDNRLKNEEKLGVWCSKGLIDHTEWFVLLMLLGTLRHAILSMFNMKSDEKLCTQSRANLIIKYNLKNLN